jgi:putative endonuclease
MYCETHITCLVVMCQDDYMNTPLFYVYILECCDKTLYTGYTNNIDKRIYEHNNTAAGAIYTRGRRPVTLVYVECCPTLSDALKKEFHIKKLSRAQKIRLIKNFSGEIAASLSL